MPIVRDPRQNQHGWWGTLTFDKEYDKAAIATFSINGDPELKYVFVKTTRESHFVSQGTAVRVEKMGDTKDDVIRQLQSSGMDATTLDLIRTDLENLGANAKAMFFEITLIDDANTTPLARMHNTVTEVCFTNDHWLDCNPSVGAGAVRAGRKLRSLKMVGAPETGQ